MNQHNFYPGMNNTEVEFFNINEEIKLIHNGKIIAFCEAPDHIINILKDAMINDLEAHSELIKWHPNNEFKQIEQFVNCRYGGLDFNADISSAGKLQKGEYWECKLRGVCKSEGKICNQIKYKSNVITSEEIELIKLLVTDFTNEYIAEKMVLKLGTLHFKKRVLYEKLEIRTKQELTIFAVKHNLIQIT